MLLLMNGYNLFVRAGMRKLLVSLAILMFSAPAFAQWRRANLYGADVRALIIDPSKPDTLYLGTSGGDVYVSNDGARSWRPARNGVPFPGHVVDNLVLDRTGRLWTASWGLWGGGVIAMSEDGGKSWSRRDRGLEDFSVRAIAVDPRDENFVIVGGLTGVYRSTDSGESWQKISDQENVESLAIDPRTHDRVYVGTWRQGIRTDDGGKTWALINNGMVLDTDMFGITINPDNPDDVWVSTCGWVYNTQNRGDNWTRYRDGFNNRRIHDVEIDPCDRNRVYAGSVAGLYRTDDRGKSWYVVSDEGLVVNTIALHPQRPDRIILGVEGDGIYVSNDAGKTFARSCEGLHNLAITSIAADPASASRIYASVVFGGMSSGIYVSEDAGSTWKKMSDATVPAALSLLVTNDPEAKLVAGTEKGFFYSDGAKWTQATPSNAPLRVDKVVMFNRQRFFAATSEGVFTSRDSGRSWYRLAGFDNRTVDIALGTLMEKSALYALTTTGLAVFDGEKWSLIENAPEKGRTLAVRHIGGKQHVFVAGLHGVKAGRIGIDRKWYDADAPDAQQAAVYSGVDSIFLTARQQQAVLVSSRNESQWNSYPLPSLTAELTSIVTDPFDTKRVYAGTMGEGIFIYEGAARPYEVKKSDAVVGAASGGGSWR
jgi:photosystem II stability/assembly factor-like uncharacterized protein